MLSWAERHLQRTEEAIHAYLRENPVLIFSQHDLERSTHEYIESYFAVRRRVPNVDLPDEVICELGDTLHALRSSLDYAAVGAVLAQCPTADEGVIAFPICDCLNNFKGARGYRLKNAPQPLADAIEKLQPYNGPNGVNAHPLWLLDRLEQPHKHRRLLDADFGVHKFGMKVVEGLESDVTYLNVASPLGPVHTRRELGRVRIARDRSGNPKAQVQAPTTFYVLFENTGPAKGEPVLILLKRIRDYIRKDVFPALEPFL